MMQFPGRWIVVSLAGMFFWAAAAQEFSPTPYAGEEKREIKALSPDEIEGYLAGRGMGLAKAAELNHYPGPMHVLELAEELRLTPAQLAAAKRLYAEMHRDAVALGAQFVAKERSLDRLFAEGKADEPKLRRLLSEIGSLQSRLRFAHLRAHLRMKRELTPEQVARYDELRGYTAREATDAGK